MIIRRDLLAAAITCVAPVAAHASNAGKLYVGFPPGSVPQMNAAVLAEGLTRTMGRAWKTDARAGDFTRAALAAFVADAAVDDKLLFATPSPGLADLRALSLIAVVGPIGNYPEPFGVYADKRMAAAVVSASRDAVDKLVQSGALPRR